MAKAASKKTPRRKAAPRKTAKKKAAATPATSDAKPPAIPPSEEAVADAVDWIVRGATERQLREALKSSHPGEKVGDVLAAAVRHFQQAADVDGWALRGWLLECWRNVYQKSLALGDFAIAIKALQRLEATANSEPPPEDPPFECSPPQPPQDESQAR